MRNHKDRANELAVPEFPGTRPKPDEMKSWLDAFEDVSAGKGLAPAANGQLPERVASKALKKRTAKELSIPPLSKDAEYKEVLAHRDLSMKVDGYIKENSIIDAEITRAQIDDRNELFSLMTEAMRRTNPGLRDALRAKFKIKELSGHYDGYRALQHVKAKMNEQVKEGAFHKHYEKSLAWMQHPKNKLREGCTTTEFSARTRQFVHYVNPYLQRQFTGEDIGRFIIEEIMPEEYSEASDRIRTKCEEEGELSDPEKVESRCLTTIVKRQKARMLSAATVPGAGVGIGEDPEDEPSEGAIQSELEKMKAAVRETVREEHAMLGGRPSNRKPRGWEPNYKTEFCSGCPHPDGSCLSNPKYNPEANNKALVRLSKNKAVLDRINARRKKAAEVMKVPYKPLVAPNPSKSERVPGAAGVAEECDEDDDEIDEDMFADIVDIVNVGIEEDEADPISEEEQARLASISITEWTADDAKRMAAVTRR
jgi:hypothetical protein